MSLLDLIFQSNVLYLNQILQVLGFKIEKKNENEKKKISYICGKTGTGGAIYLNDVVGDINDCQFTGNKADKEGGSVSLTHDSVKQNNIFY